MTPEDHARLTEAAAEVVFQASQEGRLTTGEQVLQALVAGGHFRQAEGQGDPDRANQSLAVEDASLALAGILAEDQRLASFEGLSGQRVYHCPDLLSRTYARILDRQGSPLLLMAEEIRDNSREYPRPVPVELFEEPPFALTPQDIERTLGIMAANPEYQDITFSRTSTGAVYLFSTLYLEREYARFLAQRAETLAMNP
jgi:hypothetical protein